MKTVFAVATVCYILAGGCQKPVHFPAESMPDAAAASGAFAAYDADHDGRADFFAFADSAGRVNRIGYELAGDANIDLMLPLDAISPQSCRHLVIILDGVGHEAVKKYYDEGHLRLFHRPSRVIAPYPTLTDICLEDALGYIPCPGFEAMYFDRKSNRVVGGSGAYIRGDNEPYNRLLQYRAGLIWDAIGYIYPKAVFGKELNDAKRVFDKAKTQELIAYFVSSAGMGTRHGLDGQLECLAGVERIINQVVRETRGLVKVTMFSDHGHSYTPGKPLDLETPLKKRSWRLTDRLGGPFDVVSLKFGLETYASFATNSPAELARDLAAIAGVDVASYARKDEVVVLAGSGLPNSSSFIMESAVIRRRGDSYAYASSLGDPLKLRKLLAELTPDADGYYDANSLFKATAGHLYPDSLERIWRAHFGIVENPPDVIVSLDDGCYFGSGSFGGAVDVASTHGGLNARNSTAFIMSTAGEMPEVIRSRDIPSRVSELFGRPFPFGR